MSSLGKPGSVKTTPNSWIKARLDPTQRYGLRLTLFTLAFLLVAVPFGLLLDQVMREGSLIKVDTAAANHLHAWIRESSAWVFVMEAISFLGDPIWFYAVGAVVCLVLWRMSRKRLLAFFLATTLGGGLVDTVVKVVVDRDRPSLEDPVASAHGQSFPSGHSMSSVVFYGAILLIFMPFIAKRLRFPAIAGAAVLCLAIGFSRLALGVHYITDVLGGFALGLAWLTLSVAAFSTWREERGRKPVEAVRGLEPEAAYKGAKKA